MYKRLKVHKTEKNSKQKSLIKEIKIKTRHNFLLAKLAKISKTKNTQYFVKL